MIDFRRCSTENGVQVVKDCLTTQFSTRCVENCRRLPDTATVKEYLTVAKRARKAE